MSIFDPAIFDPEIFQTEPIAPSPWLPAVAISGRYRLRASTAVYRLTMIHGRWRALT